MIIRQVKDEDSNRWLSLRLELWPETSLAQHRKEMAMMLAEPNRFAAFVCEYQSNGLVGFAEVSLREWAEGCLTSPVGYLEGWYVKDKARKQGIGRALLSATEEWARARGCTEMASDTELGNKASEAAHRSLGFEIVGRVLAFRKAL